MAVPHPLDTLPGILARLNTAGLIGPDTPSTTIFTLVCREPGMRNLGKGAIENAIEIWCFNNFVTPVSHAVCPRCSFPLSFDTLGATECTKCHLPHTHVCEVCSGRAKVCNCNDHHCVDLDDCLDNQKCVCGDGYSAEGKRVKRGSSTKYDLGRAMFEVGPIMSELKFVPDNGDIKINMYPSPRSQFLAPIKNAVSDVYDASVLTKEAVEVMSAKMREIELQMERQLLRSMKKAYEDSKP